MRRGLGRVLSVILSVAMLMGSFSVPVGAEELASENAAVTALEELQTDVLNGDDTTDAVTVEAAANVGGDAEEAIKAAEEAAESTEAASETAVETVSEEAAEETVSEEAENMALLQGELTDDVTLEDLEVLESEDVDGTITFDANGGVMKYISGYADKSTVKDLEGEGDNQTCTSQSFKYKYNEGAGTYDYDTGNMWEEMQPTREGYNLTGWYDADDNELFASMPFKTGVNRTFYAKWEATEPVITFDANGGVMSYNDGWAIEDKTVGLSGEDDNQTCTSQSFNYFEKGSGTYGISCRSLDDIEPTKDGYTFLGWYDADGNKLSTHFESKVDRTFTAKWTKNVTLDEAPYLKSEGDGDNGISYRIVDGKVRILFTVPKDAYEGIEVDDDQVLKLKYFIGAKSPLEGNSDSKDSDGYYKWWNGATITEGKDCEAKAILFAQLPTGSVATSLKLQYVVIEKDEENNPNNNILDNNVVAEGPWSEVIYDTFAAPITKVTVGGTKKVGSDLTLSPVIGQTLTSAITINTKGASIDDLAVKVTETDPAEELNSEAPGSCSFLTASINNGKLEINADYAAAGKTATVVLYDKNYPDNPVTGGTIKVTTVNPAWASKAVGAAATALNDYSFSFKITAPSGVKLDEGYYAAVKLSQNASTKIPESAGITVNDNITYVKVNSDGTIPVMSVNAFKDNDGNEVTTLGKGCGTKMDAEVYLVFTYDGGAPTDDNTLFTTTAKKLSNIATKTPYYADKITLKKATTSLYAGQSGVKVADVNLGNNTTFNTTDFWKVSGITNAAGVAVDSSVLEAKIGTSADKSNTDTGIYVTVGSEAPAGKYKLTVQTVPYAAAATLDITVLPTIASLGANLNVILKPAGDNDWVYNVYKASGKATTAKATVTAYDQDSKIIKSPKVTYEVGTLSDDAITPVSGLTVKNGTVTVAKDFEPANDTTYVLRVKANDYSGNETHYDVEFVVDTTSVNVKTLEIYTKEGENDAAVYKLLGSKDTVAWDKYDTLYFAAKNSKGEYILGEADSDDTKKLKAPVAYGDLSNAEDCVVDITAADATRQNLTKPGKVTYTVYGLDGTKASASVNYTYASDNDDYTYLEIGEESYTSGSEVDRSGNSPAETINVVLCDRDGNSSTDKVVEGSLSVSGAKIVRKSANLQDIDIVLTSPKATVTLTKSVTGGNGKAVKQKTSWTITNDALSAVAAPKASSTLVYDSNDVGSKFYAGYKYTNSDQIVITLNDCIKDSAKNIIPATTVEVSVDGPSEIASTGTYAVNQVGKKNVATVTIDFNIPDGDESVSFAASKFNLNLNYYTTVENEEEVKTYLTKAPTTVTISPATFKKSFTLNAAQTMSLKDATAIYPAYKGTGVKDVTITSLSDYNSKGAYNSFASAFTTDNDKKKLVVSSNFEDVVSVNAKTGIPNNYDGYVTCHVVFENGDVADYTSKVTVKWASQVKKYSVLAANVEKDADSPVSAVTVKGNNEAVSVKYAKYVKATDKNFDINTAPVINDDGTVTLKLSDTAKAKKGTYKTDIYVITSESRYASDSTPTTDAEWLKYAVKLTVPVKVQ